MSPRGRRPGAGAETRASILAAARALFAREGYAATSLRGIARQAGVDAALVHHYFTDKAQLYSEAVGLGMDTDRVVELVLEPTLSAPRERRGELLLRTFVDFWEDPQNADVFISIFRAALGTDASMSPQHELISTLVVREVVAHDAGSPEAAERAVALISSQLMGLVVTRYLLRLPESTALPAAEIVDRLAPQIQSVLDEAAAAGPTPR